VWKTGFARMGRARGQFTPAGYHRWQIKNSTVDKTADFFSFSFLKKKETADFE